MTRTDCPCIVCKVGHATYNQIVDVTEFTTQILYDKPKNEEAICPTCYSVKKVGELHKCSPKKDSLLNLQQHVPQKLQEQLSSKVIKDKAVASGSKETKLSTFGTPLKVSIGTECATNSRKRKAFSHEDMRSIQRDMNLSDRKTLKIAKHIREKKT